MSQRAFSERYQATEGRFDGEDTVVLTDRLLGLSGTILPCFGSNLISLANPEVGIEYIHGPQTMAELTERPVRYGNPVLLPPNRIREGRFTYADRTYHLPLNRPPHHCHGLVNNICWQVAGLGADETKGAWVQTVMDSREHPAFVQAFPFDFRLTLSFNLRGGTLTLDAEARNDGPGTFPFGIGYHTYFRLPMAAGEDPGGYRLTLPALSRWELDEGFPTGRILPVASEERLLDSRAVDLHLDDIYTDLSPGEPMIAARIWHRDTGHGIEYLADRSFPHWVVWNGPGPGSPFICLEPYSMVTNAPNLKLPHVTTGLVGIREGEAWRGHVEIRTGMVCGGLKARAGK